MQVTISLNLSVLQHFELAVKKKHEQVSKLSTDTVTGQETCRDFI